MKRLLIVSLLLAALLVLSAQAGGAKPQPDKVKVTATPIWTLAMDWPRVAYASGKEGSTEKIRVWNLVTGATSVVEKKYGYSIATHGTSEIAIAGKRLAWIRITGDPMGPLNHLLYTAPLGGRPKLLRYESGTNGAGACTLDGPQIDGLVATGTTLAVSTWTASKQASVDSDQQLDLITPTGLRTIATGPDAIVSESADAGRIAVLPLPTVLSVDPEGNCTETPPASVAIYSTSGTLLETVALKQYLSPIALSGRWLAGLRTEADQTGSTRVTLAVYDATTGAPLYTWPVPVESGKQLAVYGHLAAIEGPYRLYLVDLDTGKNVEIGPVNGYARTIAIDVHGLVYAANSRNPGKLVFVPMAKLLAMLK
ncbi:MAG TPA: hypothetical protein VMG74_06920 [Gaiellaceae bacterium]|nr:hypothetical protein [Gaiellaceae bacterium]